MANNPVSMGLVVLCFPPVCAGLVMVRSVVKVPSFGPITGPFCRTRTWSVTSCAGRTSREPDPLPGRSAASPAKRTVTTSAKWPGRKPVTLTLDSVAVPLLPVVAVPTSWPFSEKMRILLARGALVLASVSVAVRVVVPPAVAEAGLTATFTASRVISNWRICRTGLLGPGCGKVLVA